jgi:class 3 adenylate cyclase
MGIDVAVHHAIMCVDIEGFGNWHRTNRDQLAVRAGLYRALRTAFMRSQVNWDNCYREDRGDGVLILVPAEVPKELLLAPFPDELMTELARHNEVANAHRHIRLRVAVHAGEVHYDEHGVTGMAINMAFRLLDADALKDELHGSPGVLALITSQWIYDEVIRHSPQSKPGRYRRIEVANKETRAVAWISRPDSV